MPALVYHWMKRRKGWTAFTQEKLFMILMTQYDMEDLETVRRGLDDVFNNIHLDALTEPDKVTAITFHQDLDGRITGYTELVDQEEVRGWDNIAADDKQTPEPPSMAGEGYQNLGRSSTTERQLKEYGRPSAAEPKRQNPPGPSFCEQQLQNTDVKSRLTFLDRTTPILTKLPPILPRQVPPLNRKRPKLRHKPGIDNMQETSRIRIEDSSAHREVTVAAVSARHRIVSQTALIEEAIALQEGFEPLVPPPTARAPFGTQGRPQESTHFSGNESSTVQCSIHAPTPRKPQPHIPGSNPRRLASPSQGRHTERAALAFYMGVSFARLKAESTPQPTKPAYDESLDEHVLIIGAEVALEASVKLARRVKKLVVPRSRDK